MNNRLRLAIVAVATIYTFARGGGGRSVQVERHQSFAIPSPGALISTLDGAASPFTRPLPFFTARLQ